MFFMLFVSPKTDRICGLLSSPLLCSPQKTGVTALMEAAKVGSLQLVKAILKKGGNSNALDRKRFTAVHYAAMGGFFEV